MKIEKTTIFVFVAVAFIFGLLTNANANLIVNGSFENGTDPGSWLALSPGDSTSIVGWTVTRGGIDYKGTIWVASDGSRSLDLDNSPGFGGIEQTLNTTTPGEVYTVTFDIAGNPFPSADPVIKHMRVEVDTAVPQYQDFSFDVTDHNLVNMGWETTRAWQFTADSSSTTIEFYTLHTSAGGYSGYYGAAIDNVSVIPEPATVALLGLGALSLLRKRRVYMQRKGN